MSPDPARPLSSAELRLGREIASLDARIQHALRILDRREDYLAMIDWNAMTRDDLATVANHEDNLNLDIHEWDHGIEEASRELYAASLANPLH